MVGIEVPNTSVAMVKLGDLITAPQFSRARLPIGIGMDVAGKPVVADLTRMPHLLVAGATGSGKRDRKSTRLNSSHQIISYAVFCLKKKKYTKTFKQVYLSDTSIP